MRNFPLIALLTVILAGCEQKTETATQPPTEPPVTATPPPPAAAPAPAMKPAALRSPGWAPPASSDTLVRLAGRLYRLRIAVETDTTKPLTVREAKDGRPSVAQGYEGRFTFTLRDSTGRQLFQREVRKGAFFKNFSPTAIVTSGARLPSLLGYSAPMGALVFSLDFVMPDTDFGSQVLLLLDLKGQVLRTADGHSWGGGPDCRPALSADGRALLTGSEVLRAGQAPLRLEKPDAELVGALLLTDSTLLTVYSPGKVHRVQLPDGTTGYRQTPTPQQLRAPNALVRRLRDGQVLGTFQYQGFYEVLGPNIPRHYLRASKTTYLMDEKRGLYLLPRATPGAVTELKFAEMPVFSAPPKSAEVRFTINSEGAEFVFYADTTSSVPRIRYQKR